MDVAGQSAERWRSAAECRPQRARLFLPLDLRAEPLFLHLRLRRESRTRFLWLAACSSAEPRDKEIKLYLWGGAEFTGAKADPVGLVQSLHDALSFHSEIGAFSTWEWMQKGAPKPGPITDFNIWGFSLGDVYFGYEWDQWGNKALLTGFTDTIRGHVPDQEVFLIPGGLQWEVKTWANVSETEMQLLVAAYNTTFNSFFTYHALPSEYVDVGSLTGGLLVNGLLTAEWVDSIYGRQK
jgi:hypothetical protein